MVQKKTDYLCSIYGRRYGVSVTRAMKFSGLFTNEDAKFLLKKKLFGIIMSTQNVVKSDSWEKQILHIWCEHRYVAEIIHYEFSQISEDFRSNTLIITTISKHADWIYSSNPFQDDSYFDQSSKLKLPIHSLCGIQVTNDENTNANNTQSMNVHIPLVAPVC